MLFRIFVIYVSFKLIDALFDVPNSLWDNCVIECNDKLKQQYVQHFGHSHSKHHPDLELKEVLHGLFTNEKNIQDRFVTGCFDLYKPYTKCIEKCEFSIMQYFVLQALKIIDHICVENHKKWESYFDCYIKIQNETDAALCSEECSEEVSSMYATVSSVMELSTRSFDGMPEETAKQIKDEWNKMVQKSTGEICEAAHCFVSCHKSFMTRVCGQSDTKNHLLVGKQLTTLAKETFNELSFEQFWDKMCEDIFDV